MNIEGPGLTPRKALAEIAARNETTLEDMASRARRFTGKPHVKRAQFEAAQLLRGRGWSYTRIGRLLNRDHTTVMYWFWREET